jgi:hypothetical protein
MHGLEGKRGPLKPPMSARSKLALILLGLFPGTALVSVVAVWLRGGRFLGYWLAYTPLMIAIVFGPVFGRLLESAIGYHWSYMARRLIVFASMLALFGIFALASNALSPASVVGSISGVMIFIVFAAGYFVVALMGR